MNWLPQLPAMDQSMEITALISSAVWYQDHRIIECLSWKGPTRKIESNPLQAVGKPELIVFGKKPHHCGFKGHFVFWRRVGWPLSLSINSGHVRWVFCFGAVLHFGSNPPLLPLPESSQRLLSSHSGLRFLLWETKSHPLLQHTPDVLLQGCEAPKLHPLDTASTHVPDGTFLCRKPLYVSMEITPLNHIMCGCQDLSSNPLEILIQPISAELL